MPYTYEFPRPALTVDLVIFTVAEGALKVLLVRRGEAPFLGEWALPGGFVREGEGLEAAARRELAEEAGLEDEALYLEQLYSFGEPGRDPRGHTVTVAHTALVRSELALAAAGDAADAAWWPVGALPSALAFDHAQILAYAHQRLKWKLDYTSVGFELLPPSFTLVALQQLYEAILGKALDKRNFRKKLAALEVLQEVGEVKPEGPGRPAKLYAFQPEAWVRWRDRGILMPF